MPVWLCLLFCLLFTGCGSSQEPFIWQADSYPVNLDPQITREEGDLLAIRHLYRGLFALDETGEPQPEGCGEYTLSPDGSTVTFTLKEDLTWWDGVPVTSRDYAFGVSRAQDPDTGSPYREELEGILSLDCPDDRTLVVTLAEGADPARLFALPGTYPCREDFFRSCEGSYGLSKERVLGCGYYRLSSWGAETMTLTRCQGEGIETFRIASPQWEGSPTGWLETADEGIPMVTWTVLLNPGQPVFAQPQICQAFASTLYSADLSPGPGFIPARQLFPPTLGEEDCLPDLGQPGPLLWEGLKALGQDGIKGLTLLAPEDSRFEDLVNGINQELQQQLGVFCSVERAGSSTLLERVEAGDDDLALVPCQPRSGSGEELFARWAALAGSKAESQKGLLSECRVIPLFHQVFRLKTGQPVEGLWISPYTGSPDLNHASYP